MGNIAGEKLCQVGTQKRGRARSIVAIGLGAVASLLGHPAFADPVITPMPDWDAAFMQTSGWIGGDGASAATLSDGRTIWVFSDTIVGDVVGGQRTNWTFVHNSAGIHTTPATPGAAPEATDMEFAIGMNASSDPDAWIVPDIGVLDETGGPGLWWPVSVLEIPGPSGSRIVAGGVHKGLRSSGVGLDQLGDILVVIEDWETEPFVDWSANASHHNITHSVSGLEAANDPDLYVTKWGRAFYLDEASTGEAAGGWLYIYAVQNFEAGERRIFVARAPAHDVENMATWSFYGVGEAWVSDPLDAVPIATTVTNFMTVDRLSNGVYVMIHSELPNTTSTIMLRTAHSPEGPWSEPTPIYTIPKDIPDVDPGDYLYYGAVAHGDLSDPGHLLISYVSNTAAGLGVLNDPQIYVPRFVALDLASVPATAIAVPIGNAAWLALGLLASGIALVRPKRRHRPRSARA